MQQVTLEYLEGLNACSSGIRYYQTLGGIADPTQVIRACIRDEEFSHARWLMARLLSRPGKIAWAIFSAEQVIEIYEKRYPDNKAPRNAIEAAKAVLENDSPESREAAHLAQRAAADAAATAYATAYAAYADAATAYAAADAAAAAAAAYATAYAAYADAATAYAAADAAADAAAAAAAAAYATAYATAYAAYADAATATAYAAAYAAADAARREMRISILEYGIALLEKECK